MTRLRGRVAVAAMAVAVAAAVLVAAGGVAGRVGPQQRAGTGFGPVAASFLSRARGFVFGTEGCRFEASGLPCPGLLAVTGDGGAEWRFRPAPAAGMDQAGQVVFASSRTGWQHLAQPQVHPPGRFYTLSAIAAASPSDVT